MKYEHGIKYKPNDSHLKMFGCIVFAFRSTGNFSKNYNTSSNNALSLIQCKKKGYKILRKSNKIIRS
jgi:hypothetical protein